MVRQYSFPRVDIEELTGEKTFYQDSILSSIFVNDDYINQTGVHLSGLEIGTVFPGTVYIHYLVPTPESIKHWCETINVKYIRIGFSLERMFHSVNADINQAYVSLLKGVVDQVLSYGKIPIIDAHNFSKYYNNVLGSSNFTVENFKRFWGIIADNFSYNSVIEFDIMNEPTTENMTSEAWVNVCNDVISVIRNKNYTNIIHVSTQAFSAIAYLFNLERLQNLERISDPLRKWVLHLHFYLDDNFSGTGDNITSSDINSLLNAKRVVSAIRDLQKLFPFLKVHVGEFGGTENDIAVLAYYNCLEYFYENRDVFRSWTAWGAGNPWADSYPLKIEPFSNGTFSKKHEIIKNLKYTLGKINPPSSLVYLDLINNVFSHSTEEVLSCNRETEISYSQNKHGNYVSFPRNTLRITDKGLHCEDFCKNLVSRSYFTNQFLSNLNLETSKEDFTGTNFGYSLKEISVDNTVKYMSCIADNILEINKTYSFQYLFDFKENLYTFTALNTPYLNTIDGYYFPNLERKEGTWKPAICRITRDNNNSYLRARIGIQKIQIPSRLDIPDSYSATIPLKQMNICCPMIYEGKRNQSPIFSSSSNAIRQADEIIVNKNILNPSLNMTIILEVKGLTRISEIADFLSINNKVVLRKNLDFSIGGDFNTTVQTEVPFNTINYFLIPRKIGISLDIINKKVTVGAEGVSQFTTDFDFNKIDDIKILPFGGYLTKFIVVKDYYENLQEFLK